MQIHFPSRPITSTFYRIPQLTPKKTSPVPTEQIMQTKSMEPGTHSTIARYFGLVFLFEALVALFTALAEQFYAGAPSFYFAVLASISCVLAICVSIPAAIAIALPEPNHRLLQIVTLFASVTAIALATIYLSPFVAAAPDLPYIAAGLRKDMLAGVASAITVLFLAACVRMARRMKGRNGAFILFAALVLTIVFGAVWMTLEPLCTIVSDTEAWSEECPLSHSFDHNFMMTILLIIANVLAAEGVLRLMAAGTGVEGYVEIIPVIQS